MIGRTIGHFKITSKLGQGGMGEVYRAEDSKLGRGVAIKTLPEALAADPDRLSRFEREAKVLASLNHPNISGIHQVEEVDGAWFLVMELVDGEDLGDRISRGALPLDEALPIALQIAEALEAAHDRNVIHRDLKPANIKVTPEGQVKVLDFGLAKALEGDPTTSGSAPTIAQSPTLTARMTGAGMLIGTAAYMAPEQARGQATDRRADVWAFGVVLFEMLTGKMVYTGDTISDTLAGVLAREPEWESLSGDLPYPVRRLLERCLEKDLRRRLQAIGEARIAIERYLEDPAVGRLPEASETAPTPAWKRLAPWAAAGILAVALGATLVARLGGSASGDARPVHSSLALQESRILHRGYGSPIALSPDGDRVAQVFQVGTTHEIQLRAIDQWAGTPLVVGSAIERPYQPFFSPDGKWLGFVTTNALKKVPISGGTPITLCDVSLSRGASWSPDGTIVFAPNPASGLFRVPAAGGEPEQLTELDTEKNETTHRWPQVLPGGEAVLFTVHSSEAAFDGARIELLELASNRRRLVHQGGTYARYVGSGHLIYMNQGTLFALPFDLPTLEVTGSAAPVVQDVGGSGEGGAYYDVSNDGLLAYSVGTASGAAQLEAVWVDREGAIEPLTAEQRGYASPRFSPDGRRLAVEFETEGNVDVWILDLERDVPTRLTFHEGYDGKPVWSPDGESIAFASARGEGAQNVYVHAADGSGEAVQLGNSDWALTPWSWSPDGKTITVMVQHPETNLDLALLSVEDGGLEPFLATPFLEYAPVYSPDGRWIAYGNNESGEWEVYVRPADGGRGKWQISSGGGTYPTWSRDGREIFLAVEGGLMAVTVDAAGGRFRADRPRELFSGSFANLSGNNAMYDVAPDARRFVLFQGEFNEAAPGHEHVRLITNWFAELERTFSR